MALQKRRADGGRRKGLGDGDRHARPFPLRDGIRAKRLGAAPARPHGHARLHSAFGARRTPHGQPREQHLMPWTAPASATTVTYSASTSSIHNWTILTSVVSSVDSLSVN